MTWLKKDDIKPADRFRYFLGVCKHMLIQRVEAARAIIAEGGV